MKVPKGRGYATRRSAPAQGPTTGDRANLRITKWPTAQVRVASLNRNVYVLSVAEITGELASV